MNLFLDTDIGSDVDDALALALIVGSPELHLRGVSTVYGDTLLRARLTKRYLRIAREEHFPPIAAGLRETRSGAPAWWAGHEGKLHDNLEAETVSEDGVGLLTTVAAGHAADIDILGIGPLTNIAAALDADPTFERNVRRLVLMGGDFRDDRIAEHNIKSDIAAAQRVIASDLDILIGGLDLTFKIQLNSDDVDRIAAAGGYGSVIADEIRVWWQFNDNRADLQWNSPHDPVLALAIAQPELFTFTRVALTIDDDGFTTVEPDESGRVQVINTENPDAVRAAIVERIIAASAATAAVPKD